jgi:hypothetical protein
MAVKFAAKVRVKANDTQRWSCLRRVAILAP